MKKTAFYICIGAILIAGCKPVNPPQSDNNVVKIIEILYNGMGKPASTCLEPLAEMGIDVPYNETDSKLKEFDEGYFLKTDDYDIGFACYHDSITLARYTCRFRSTYVDGVKQFHIADDEVYGFGWDQWQGDYKSTYKELSQHDAAMAEIDSLVAEDRKAHCHIMSTYQKLFNNKYLFSCVFYWGVSIGGMDPNTGNGLSEMADGEVSVEFSLRNTPSSAFD